MPTPRTATQDERSDAARASIIAAAITLLAEEGYRRTTFTRIQEVAGVSRGLVTYHFGSKSKLIEAVISSTRDTFAVEALESSGTSGTGLDAVMAMVSSYIRRLEINSKPASIMLVLAVSAEADEPEVKKALTGRYAEMRDQLVGWIERGKQDGSIAGSIDSVAYAAVVEGIVRGVALQYIVDPGAVNIPCTEDAAVAAVRAALTGR